MTRILMTVMLAVAMLAGCQTTKPTPPPSVSLEFDGNWKGERFDVSGASNCMPTEISGKISEGYMNVTLHYNNTSLTGWINQDGLVSLESDNFKWNYKFSGKAAGNKIEGQWSVGNALCRGTWYVTRR